MAALPSLITVSPGNSPAGRVSSSAAVSVGARLTYSAGGLAVGTSGVVFRGSMDLSPRPAAAAAAALPKLHQNVCVAERVQAGCRGWETTMMGSSRAVRTSIKVHRLDEDKHL